MAIFQTETTATPECTLEVNSITTSGQNSTFIFANQGTSGTPVTYSVPMTGSSTPESVVTDMVIEFNNANSLHKCTAVAVNGTFLQITTDVLGEGDDFTIDVDTSPKSWSIDNYLPKPYAWTQDPANRVEPDQTKQELGWTKKEKPALQWWNYLLSVNGNISSYIYGLGVNLKKRLGLLEDEVANLNSDDIANASTEYPTASTVTEYLDILRIAYTGITSSEVDDASNYNQTRVTQALNIIKSELDPIKDLGVTLVSEVLSEFTQSGSTSTINILGYEPPNPELGTTIPNSVTVIVEREVFEQQQRINVGVEQFIHYYDSSLTLQIDTLITLLDGDSVKVTANYTNNRV